MKYELYSQQDEKLILAAAGYNKDIIFAAINSHLDKYPDDTLEYSINDEIVDFYETRAGAVVKLIFKGTTIFHKKLNTNGELH